MSKEREQILFPVGRLVGGSLYTPSTTNMQGQPLVFKSGPHLNQPRNEFRFFVAIKKNGEQSWAQTEWGQKIYNLAISKFTRGEPQQPTFAWKIVDGDSQIINMNNIKPCDKEGYPGHWVLKFTGGFAPSLVKPENGLPLDLPQDAIYPGCYVQVIGNVSDNMMNGVAPKPGIFLNHSHVAFCGYGEKIFFGVDPKSVAWSREVPAGASSTPISTVISTPTTTPEHSTPVAITPPSSFPTITPGYAPAPIVPYPQILNVPLGMVPATPPPPPAAPIRKMLPPSQGATYEQMIAIGWTDETLVQHGMMAL